MANKVPLIFEVFAIDKAKGTFGGIIKSTDTLGTKVARLGKLAAGAAAAGIVAFAGVGVRSFLEFDDAMNQSLAIMGEVSGPMRQRMEEAAREVGKTTRFGANEAAESYFFLASAGMDAEQAISAMPQVARFAQAGMFDLATATDLATDAQSALGLAVDDPAQNLQNLTRVTDVLVGANTLANASVQQFSTSLTQKAGPALRATGKEIEEGVAVLAAFADQGVKGERAGTMLTATLDGLQRTAIDNADAYEQLNIAVFDGSGNMRNMSDIVSDMEAALGGMSTEQQRAALMQLGLNRQALDGVLSLTGLSGQIRQYEGDLREMGGVTEEVADNQLQSFSARLDLLKSNVLDVATVLGGELVNAAFSVGETVQEMARMFGELPDPIQKTLLGLTAVVTAAPLVVAGFRKLKSTVDSVRLAYAAMGTTARVATVSLGVVGVALAAGATILAFFAHRNLEAKERVEALRNSLDQQTGAITENTRVVAAKELQDRGLLDAAEQLGLNLEMVTDAALGDRDAMRELEQATRGLSGEVEATGIKFVDANGEMLDQQEIAEMLNNELANSREELQQVQEEQRQMGEAVGESAGAEADLEAAVGDANELVDEQTSAIDDLIKSLDDMVAAVFETRDAERDFEAALDDATAAAKENGETLDITTEKGRDNQEQLDRLAESALKDAAATLEDAEAKGDLAAGHDEATKKMERAREEFIEVAKSMGSSTKEAEALADELGLIPGNYKATVTADTGPARRQVGDLRFWISQQGATIPVTVAGGGRHQRYQHGGFARRGTAALVGEAGPEMVVFGQNARVFSNPDTKRLRDALESTPSPQTRQPEEARHEVATAPAVMTLKIDSTGSRIDDLLVEVLRHSIRTNPALRAELKSL